MNSAREFSCLLCSRRPDETRIPKAAERREMRDKYKHQSGHHKAAVR